MSLPTPDPGPAPSHGVLGAKRAIRDFLQNHLQGYLDWLRVQWSLEPEDLIVPTTWLDHEPQILDNENTEAPLIAATIRAPETMRVVDYAEAGANPLFEITYPMRVFLWSKRTEFDKATYERDGLITGCRDALIDVPDLNAGPAFGINLNTVTGDYSEVKKVNGDRYLCGGSVSFDLRVHEAVSLYRGGVSVIGEVDLGLVYPLRPDPADPTGPVVTPGFVVVTTTTD